MGRERRVDGPSTARPPHRFEVDLTSVCVRSGAVQLPYRLQGAFGEGPVAAVDVDGGASLDLQFRPPRELLGLRGFFEVHELRPNDRIGLVFTDAGLRVEAVKRERKAPAAGPRPESGRVRAERAASATASGEPPRAVSEARQGAAPAAPPDRVREDASRSAASSAPPSLRLATPAPSVPADEGALDPPRPAASRTPRWEPLDVTVPREDAGGGYADRPRRASEEAVQHSEAPMRVREVRRGSPLSAPGSRPPEPEENAGAPTEPVPHRHEAPSRPSAAERSEPERPPRPLQGRGLDLFGLRRRFGFGRGEPQTSDRSEREEPAGPARVEGSGDPEFRQAAIAADAPEMPGPVAVSAPEPVAAVGIIEPEASMDAPLSEEDIRAVAAYLARPDVPAIVRAERVAEELGLAVARVDGALDRISESSEHLSRIRAGAYMLRHPGSG